MEGGGTYSNMFNAHPPFQIDGNFGATAGIAEMLLQSHSDDIFVLPALPDNWNSGSVKGLRARGGFILDFEWKNGMLKNLIVYSTLGGNCRIRSQTQIQSKDVFLLKAEGTNPNAFYSHPNLPSLVLNENATTSELILKETYVYDFKTDKGKKYKLIAK